MVKYQKVDLDRLVYAISDSTRRGIIDELVRGERSVGELAEPYKMTPPAISKHIRVLHETGLISVKRQGRQMMCKLEPDSLIRVSTWLAKYQRFWEAKLQELEAQIRANVGKKTDKGQ